MSKTYARFPLVAADRRSGEDRRVDVAHALAQPMPRRMTAQEEQGAIEADLAHIMKLARECAHKLATPANWHALESAIRHALLYPIRRTTC